MGQSVSRRVVPYLQRAMQRGEAEAIEEAIQDVAEKKRQALSVSRYSDPSSLLGGFTRGLSNNVGDLGPNSHHAHVSRERDARQEEFLKEKNDNIPDEMPDELLKFLNDMGPAQRSVDESRTSKRILKKGKETGNVDEVIEDLEKEQRNRRRQLWATHTAANTAMIPEDSSSIENMDGGSETKEECRNEKEDDILLYKEEQLSSLLKNILDVNDTNKSGLDNLMKELKIDNATLEKISCSISYPIIMKDTDDELVGAWQDKINDLKQMGLTIPGINAEKTSNKLSPKFATISK